jgi:dipeptidyl aminopeptidase/acylaminoacyl peptidase
MLAFLLAACGCARRLPPGQEDVPPGLRAEPGVYADINPRWSHDGKRVAFLRSRSDRRLQLYVIDEDLERPLPQLEDELVTPDRPYDSNLRRYCSPDTLAWSPNDREIAFERVEWFTFDDGQRLPGTGLWSLDTFTGRVTPLALHPKTYLSLFYYYHAPQWSPDGRYLTFVGEGINGQRVIFVRAIPAQKAAEVVPRFDGYQDSDWPTWQPAPAGPSGIARRPSLIFRQGIVHALAGSRTETLRRLAPGGIAAPMGEIWRLRDRDYAHLLDPANPDDGANPRAGHLAWSPDGRRIAFTLTPDATDYTHYELWVMNADGSGARRASKSNGHGYLAPVWIDDRHLGALTAHGDRYDVVSIDIMIHVIHLLGTIDSADCDWSPDRTRIVYALPGGTQMANNGITTLRIFQTHVGQRRVETAAIHR